MNPGFTSAGLTDQGRVRKHNEDAFLDASSRRLWVVADGMGGHSAGDLASQTIVDRLGRLSLPDSEAELVDALDIALGAVNSELRDIARQRKVRLIGATVVVLAAGPQFMVCGWAGDSRIYRYRAGQLEQVTQDHSSYQEMLDSGTFTLEELHQQPQSGAITRAVGGESQLVLDWKLLAFEPGAQYLLCSDGLTKEVPDDRIAAEFDKALEPQQTAANLLNAALENGGRDNVTVLVVRTGA
jgi:protein phosphatase